MLKPRRNDFTKEEELELGRKIQLGLQAEQQIEDIPDSDFETRMELADLISEGKDAQTALFEVEVGLANNLARKLYERAGVRYSMDDIAQDAYVALYKATTTYNPNKKCRFSTHAYYQISKMISTRLNKMRTIRLPENKMGDYLHISNAEKEYMAQCKGSINTIEMQDYVLKTTGLSKEVYLSIKSAMQPVTSTSTPISENVKFEDLLEDKDAKSTIDIDTPLLAKILEALPEDDQIIISLAYGIGTTLGITYNEYLQEKNLTPETMEKRVRQILRKLRKEVKSGEVAV